GVWHSKEELKVELKGTEAWLATLAIVKSAKLKLSIHRGGKPMAGLSYELELDAPSDAVRGKTDKDGNIDLPVPPLTKGGRLYLNLAEPDKGAPPGVVKSKHSATDALVLVFDAHPADKAVAERMRLQNQGY